MAQGVIDEHQRQHRLGDWRRANADAGVVTAVCFDACGLAGQIHRLAWQPDAGGRLDRHVHDDFLPGVSAAHVLARLAKAGGDELDSGKFASPESSAALACNTFGWFVDRPDELPPLPQKEEDGMVETTLEEVIEEADGEPPSDG